MTNFKNFGSIALSAALLTSQPQVRQKLHVHSCRAAAITCWTAPFGRVVGEVRGGESAHPRLGRPRKQITDWLEQSNGSRRSTRRRAPDWAGIDNDHTPSAAQAANNFLPPSIGRLAAQSGYKAVHNQRALARTRRPADARERSECRVKIDAFQVVKSGPSNTNLATITVRGVLLGVRSFERELAKQSHARQATRGGHNFGWRSCRDDVSAIAPRTWPDIYNEVRPAHQRLVVLDHEHSIAPVAHSH